jgi:hypothetical protein
LRRRPEPLGHGQLRLVRDPVRPDAALGSSLSGRREPVPTPFPADLVRPQLTYGVEPFVDIARELPSLLTKHWEELESDGFGLPLSPDWDLMFDMAQLGRLHVNTARYGKALVGYIFNFVLPHIYTKDMLQGQIHLFYLHPSYRREPWFVVEWFQANDQFLKSLGCRKIYAMSKTGYRDGKAGAIFKRLGYTKVEEVYARMT